MFKLEHVSKSFGANQVLSDVSFGLGSGELVGLVGPSGAGKSVLLKVLGGVLEPDSGQISFLRGNSASVGFLFQEGALFDSMTVLENVAFPLANGRLAQTVAKSEIFNQAYEMLSEVGLAKSYAKHPGQLSGGMRRRVGIARALIGNPELVLLDDPTGGLDPVAASVIMNLIIELHQAHKAAMVLVSHDIRRLLPRIGRLLGLFSGRIAVDCKSEEIWTQAPQEVINFLATRYDRPDAEFDREGERT